MSVPLCTVSRTRLAGALAGLCIAEASLALLQRSMQAAAAARASAAPTVQLLDLMPFYNVGPGTQSPVPMPGPVPVCPYLVQARVPCCRRAPLHTTGTLLRRRPTRPTQRCRRWAPPGAGTTLWRSRWTLPC
jgi:hypothetical protein